MTRKTELIEFNEDLTQYSDYEIKVLSLLERIANALEK